MARRKRSSGTFQCMKKFGRLEVDPALARFGYTERTPRHHRRRMKTSGKATVGGVSAFETVPARG